MQDKTFLTCLFCKHFHFWSGQPDYSECTPGENASIGCSLDIWEMDYGDDQESFREDMRRAAKCEKFELREGEK